MKQENRLSPETPAESQAKTEKINAQGNFNLIELV